MDVLTNGTGVEGTGGAGVGGGIAFVSVRDSVRVALDVGVRVGAGVTVLVRVDVAEISSEKESDCEKLADWEKVEDNVDVKVSERLSSSLSDRVTFLPRLKTFTLLASTSMPSNMVARRSALMSNRTSHRYCGSIMKQLPMTTLAYNYDLMISEEGNQPESLIGIRR